MLRTSQNALTLLVECRFWYSVCSKYNITDTHAPLTEKAFFSFIFSCYEERFKSTFADKYQNRVVCRLSLSISALLPLSNSSSSLTVNLNIFPITLFVNPYPTPRFASSLFFCQSLCQHTFVIDGIKHSILMNHLL